MSRKLLIFVFLLAGYSIYATSPIMEYFEVRNYSIQTILITREYRNDPDKIFYTPETHSWIQNICGMNMMFTDVNLEINERRVTSDLFRNRAIILYYSPGPNMDRLINGIPDWKYLDQLPFLDMMQSIYSSFVVTAENGEIIFTLENLGERMKREVTAGGLRYYYFEIFDSDIVNGSKEDNTDENSIKYISWENTIYFINNEEIKINTFDRYSDNSTQIYGTYELNIENNITFLNVKLENGINEKWLLLANGTICDIYKADGWHLYGGVTGSVNRNELFGSFFNPPWTRGNKQYEINEKIIFEDGYIPNGSMHISIGNVSYNQPYLYTQYSRPKKIWLSVENKFSIIVELLDTPHYQEIKFPEQINNDDKLVLEILEIYNGTLYENICINIILFERNSQFYKRNNYWDN